MSKDVKQVVNEKSIVVIPKQKVIAKPALNSRFSVEKLEMHLADPISLETHTMEELDEEVTTYLHVRTNASAKSTRPALYY